MKAWLLLAALSILAIAQEKQSTPEKKPQDCSQTAKTQFDLSRCASQEVERAESDLNQALGALLEKKRGDSEAVRKIRTAEKAWVMYRDAQMQAAFPAADQSVYGSSFAMCFAKLRVELTQERTKTLKQMLNPPEGEACTH